MNEYGQRAMVHWKTHRPAAYRSLQDPEAFFTAAGEEIATEIAALTPQLAGVDLPGEAYLDKVARLNNARTLAAEIATSQSGMFSETELTRQEWEDTTQEHEMAMLDWAWDASERAEAGEQITPMIAEAQARFLLPADFLAAISAAPSPREFLRAPENRRQWLLSVERRWERDSAAN